LLFVPYGLFELGRRVNPLHAGRYWARVGSRRDDDHKEWHEKSVKRYKEYLDEMPKTRSYGEVFGIEASVTKGFPYAHEFDRPGKWIENLRIWEDVKVQVLSKSNKKKNGIFKQLTCAWFHPTHGLLIGNIKKQNLQFDDEVAGKSQERHRLGHSKTNGTPVLPTELPTEPKVSNPESKPSSSMMESIQKHTLAFWEKTLDEKKKSLGDESIKQAKKAYNKLTGKTWFPMLSKETKEMLSREPDSEEREKSKETHNLFDKLRRCLPALERCDTVEREPLIPMEVADTITMPESEKPPEVDESIEITPGSQATVSGHHLA